MNHRLEHKKISANNNNNNNDNNDDFHTAQDLQKRSRVIIIIDGYGHTQPNYPGPSCSKPD